MNDSPANSSPCTAAAAWKQRYEALRQLAVTGNRILGTDPLGWVLLLRQGVAGWMCGWAGLAQMPPAAPVRVSALPPASLWQQQLTELLAEMSLAHLPSSTTL
jgi:hypothetical protein